MSQETLLCILLYLLVIFSPSVLYQSEVDQHEQDNQAAIDDIYDDPTLEAQIVTQYSPQLEFLDVIDDHAVN